MILSIETGGDICSVALSKDNELISLRESDGGKNHAKDVALFIQEIFQENDIDGKDLKAVAVSKGPGSYTGLRIGVSVAKGLCYGANIPLIAVNSLESLAAIAIEEFNEGLLDVDSLEGAILCPMLDARRMEVYEQLYTSSCEPLTEVNAHIITPESFIERSNSDKFIIFGSGAEKCVETLSHIKGLKYINIASSARGVASRAHIAYKRGEFEDFAYFEPMYLKEFVAGKPKKLL